MHGLTKKWCPSVNISRDKNDFARFAIEGMDSKEGDGYAEAYVEDECRCYCQTCNKFVELKSGDRIPPCCGKLMEVLD